MTKSTLAELIIIVTLFFSILSLPIATAFSAPSAQVEVVETEIEIEFVPSIGQVTALSEEAEITFVPDSQ